MKNCNYNLLKVLHGKLDNVWRIEKHYLGDAGGLDCDCGNILKNIVDDDRKHIAQLEKELARHISDKTFS